MDGVQGLSGPRATWRAVPADGDCSRRPGEIMVLQRDHSLGTLTAAQSRGPSNRFASAEECPIRIPLSLVSTPHWELTGEPDPTDFFVGLGQVFATASTLFFEGTSIAPDVEDLLRESAEPGDFLPERQTLWPRSTKLRVRFDEGVLTGLAGLADRHAVPEICDHLFLYDGETPLLEYPDAFLEGSVIYVSSSVSETRLRDWADANDLNVGWRGVQRDRS